MRAKNLTSSGSSTGNASTSTCSEDSSMQQQQQEQPDQRPPQDSNADDSVTASSSSFLTDESTGGTSNGANDNDNANDSTHSASTPIRTPSALSPTTSSLSSSIPATPGQKTNPALSVLFLSSDTGGGHRASATSLGRQFELLYPGTTYRLLDVVTECMPTTPSQSFGAGNAGTGAGGNAAAGSSGSFGSSSSSMGGDQDGGDNDDKTNDSEEQTSRKTETGSEGEGKGQEKVPVEDKVAAEDVLAAEETRSSSESKQDDNAGDATEVASHDEGSGSSSCLDNVSNSNAKNDVDVDSDNTCSDGGENEQLNLPTLHVTKTASGAASVDEIIAQERNTLPPRPSSSSGQQQEEQQQQQQQQQQQVQTTGTNKKSDTTSSSSSSAAPPAFGIESFYKHLSAHPHQWRLLYHTTNTPPVRLLTDVGLKLATERSVTAKIRSINPDVVISVHPMMNSIPSQSCAKISSDSGRHLPFFTVVTDLGSGHDAWFAGKREVERIFLASDSITDLAVRRGRIPRDKIVRSGLPIRHEFAVHARGMGSDRSSDQGRRYRMTIRRDKLNLSSDPDHRVVLVMGGGEGCGALSSIVDSLYVDLCSRSVDATVVVVCGRNETLKETLETRDWEGLRKRGHKRAERRRKTVALAQRVRRMLSSISTGDLRGSAEAAAATSVRAEDANANEQGNDGDGTGGGAESPGSTSGAVEEKDDAPLEGEGALRGPEAELCTSSAEARDENDSCSEDEKDDPTTPASPAGDCLSPCSSMESLAEGSASVQVKPLGFVTNIGEYMVGADLLISKAGPGTIAEAASLGLPVLLTSYLPGQEEGNIDFVIENGFGAYVADSDPNGVAKQCSSWLRVDDALAERSRNAMEAGVPNAAEDIARHIGQSVVRWMQHNEGSS